MKFERRGFTIIEILVVIAIISILSAIIVTYLNGYLQKAKLSRAKTEVKQIITAAAQVYEVYGYYPSDSLGSITCPADIIIDPITNTKWGKFINICNDPWGRPYYWNNQCASGAIRKADGSNSNCLPFSDTDGGPIGVTILGADNTNDSCTGDDICYGDRGFPIYNWFGTSDVSSQSGNNVCTTTVAQCSSLSIDQCQSRSGCFLQNSACTGTFSDSCSTFTTQSSCTPIGCSWTTGGSCGGSVSCSVYSSDQTSCQNDGCAFSAEVCTGSASCSQWNNTTSGTCTTNHPGCSWSGGTKKCNGTMSCDGLSQSLCTPTGCLWQSSSCSGSPSCSSFGQSQCSTTTGCTWTGTSSCQGTYQNNCSTYNNLPLSCQSTTGCTWSSAACTGTATSCSTSSDQTICNNQAGCLWQ